MYQKESFILYQYIIFFFFLHKNARIFLYPLKPDAKVVK